MELTKLLKAVQDYSGVRSKQRLQTVLRGVCGGSRHSIKNGDDAAVIPNGDRYNLFAMEGFIPEFVAHDPWFAGWCGVMVNCSDIAAMGGKPTAITNAIWCQNDEVLIQLLRGMTAASVAFDVPIIGGHTCMDTTRSQLSVSILGEAQHILSSFDAKEGDAMICAIDLRGQYREPFLNWNAATSAPPGQLIDDIALLPALAAMPGVTGAKDISQAGILGTATMFMDCSELGIDIELTQIPKPVSVDWLDWLRSFPSFGYLITCAPECVADVEALFASRDIYAKQIGELNRSRKIKVHYQQQCAEFWDLSQAQFMVPKPLTENQSKEACYASNDL